MTDTPCSCPGIDGYRIRNTGCPVHGQQDAQILAAKAAERAADVEEQACDWSDFRKDYGVSGDETVRRAEHRAFLAGWAAGRHGDRSGALR